MFILLYMTVYTDSLIKCHLIFNSMVEISTLNIHYYYYT